MKNLLLVVVSVLVMLTFSNQSFAVGESLKPELSNPTSNSTLTPPSSKPKSSKEMTISRKPVNLNSAEAKEIADNLVGIGLKKAETIVAYRNQYGAFKTIEDLALIKGIGVKTIAKNEGFILLN